MIGSVGAWTDFDTMAPPYDHYSTEISDCEKTMKTFITLFHGVFNTLQWLQSTSMISAGLLGSFLYSV